MATAMGTGAGNPYQDLIDKQQRQQQTAQSPQPVASQYAQNVSGATQRASSTPAPMSATPQASSRGILGGLGGIIGGIVGGIASGITGGGSKPSSSGSTGGGTSGTQQSRPSQSVAGAVASVGNAITQNRPQSTQTTYIDPNNQQQTGYIINGVTYKDPYGQNRVDVGSRVQTGGGWYQLGADGKGVAISNPYAGMSGGTGGTTQGTQNWGTQQKPIAVQYWDKNGNRQIGYMINGQTYVDQAGTQRIGEGSRVPTGGGWYEMTANGGVKIPGYTQTTYEDAYGNKNIAYIGQDGLTYQNPVTGERIPVGSIVNTANGKYVMTANGGVPITDAEIEQQRQNRIFQQRQQQAIDAINAATDAGVLAYQQMIPGINSQYDTAAKQLYTNFMQENQAMPEQLAKMGLSGQGISESTAASLANSYQGNLSASELARRSAIQDVNNQVANLRAEAEAQKAQTAYDLSGEQFRAWQWAQELQRQIQQFQQQQEWNKYTWEKEFGMAQDQDAYDRQLDAALRLAEYGDFSGFKALGYNDAQIAGMGQKYLEDLAAQSYAALSSGRSSGRSSGGRSSGRKGGGRSSGSRKGGSSSGGKSQDYTGLFEAAKASGRAKSFIANNYKSFGFTSSSGLYGDYQVWNGQGDILNSAIGAIGQVGNAGSNAGYSFAEDMAAIESGKITYQDIINGSLDDLFYDAYGLDKYKQLVQRAYELSKK